MLTSLRIISTALALTLGATALSSPAHGAAGFDDVEADRWYTAPIAWLVEEGITTGTEPGCFAPHDAVTRGQVVAFLHRLDEARGNSPQSATHPFEDVVAAYQQDPVGWAYLNTITVGTTETTFAPNDDVTRGDFAVLLWRYAGRPAASEPHPFDDVDRAYQQTAIAWMDQEAITTGTSPTTFSPEATMTRAEAATFLFRFMEHPPVAALLRTSEQTCLAPLRHTLANHGLTVDEAACAAPHLAEFTPERVTGLLNGTEAMTLDMLGPIADIAAQCIPAHRRAALVQLFL